jgi:hypothetical protein
MKMINYIAMQTTCAPRGRDHEIIFTAVLILSRQSAQWKLQQMFVRSNSDVNQIISCICIFLSFMPNTASDALSPYKLCLKYGFGYDLIFMDICISGRVAQWIEHLPTEQGVAEWIHVITVDCQWCDNHCNSRPGWFRHLPFLYTME